MKIITDNLARLSKTSIVPQEVFVAIREQITYMERIHSKTYKDFLGVHDKFWKFYDINEFCEHEGVSREHLMRCKRGDRQYSPRIMEAIINHVKKVTT